ncbi:DUF4136 domain-containing protein [Flavobacterium sp. CS20]|uniref:DUF4136 domain-containing protein n=1 Tax=Flavobacterium sp. CS20 TaxID=2775246 RepID=UPI001B3A4073|nr:DUF4136 domain-containing protein [Flavobacterium sp. CS20]QTY27538.1 DUF4136 domain-containing protein [Flavobacterium sp. CS20]
MKNFLILCLTGLLFSSCATINVATDYDKEVNFDQYNTYAFFKPGIDKAQISDLDKKRILRAIDFELSQKGMTKSENPDILVSFFTQTKEKINVYQDNFGYGWGWSPYYWGGAGRVSSYANAEGTLFIDLIDAERNELVWQGLGTGALSQDMERKEEKIKEIVKEILKKYPPQLEDKK